MDKQCDKFIEAILSTDGKYSDEVNEHIRKCQYCRVMASEWKAVRSVTSQIEVPQALDASVRRAASERGRRASGYRQMVYKFIYVTAAAACIMLIGSIFMFSDKLPRGWGQPRTMLANAWHSPLEKKLFEVDTEIEINREMINIGQEPEVDVEAILYPSPDETETIEISADTWI